MRRDLAKLPEEDYLVYGINSQSFSETIRFAADFVESREAFLDADLEAAIVPEGMDAAVAEVESDLRFYAKQDENFLWGLCLVRLLGLFEGFLIQGIISRRQRKEGFRNGLELAMANGLEVSKRQHAELCRWNRLRNMIVHSPPEQYRPVAIDRLDMEELCLLLTEIVSRCEK